MEKISLKPVIKELLFKKDGHDSFYDVISYRGTGIQESTLGSLFVLGNVKNGGGDDELSYVINLASSIAKREYYSDLSLKERDPRQAFERMLKKTNETLVEFFNNKNLKIDLAIVAVTGQNMYVSRIGKLKVILSRGSETIDVLNNVQLFNKELTDNDKEFSNIISGKLKSDDKIFAYLPFRTMVSREKQLKEALVSGSQTEFEQKLATLASTVPSFYCCGIHLSMAKIKEIPVEMPDLSSAQVRFTGVNASGKDEEETNESIVESETGETDEKIESEKNIKEEDAETEQESEPEEEKENKIAPPMPLEIAKNAPPPPRIMSSELSLAKKHNAISSTAMLVSRFRGFNKYDTRTKTSLLVIIAGIMITGIFGFIFFGLNNSPFNEENQAVTKLEEEIKIANSQITQNNIRDARDILKKSLAQLANLNNKKATELKASIISTISNINKVSSQQPTLVADIGMLSSGEIKTWRTGEFDGGLVVIAENNDIYTLAEEKFNNLGALNSRAKYFFSLGGSFSILDGLSSVNFFDGSKMSSHTLNSVSPANDHFIYADNVYAISGNDILKFTDGAKETSKSSIWGTVEDEIISLAVDGDIYGLSKNGKLIKYFKGGKESELDLAITPSDSSRIWTEKDFAFVYVVNISDGNVMVFDKTSGQLKTTYDFSSAGKIIDINISTGGKITTLSEDNKIWQITP
ncbi:MAG: hypothetical protein Q8Q06_00285 [bacterium]|nr:hypothetical protein [bacterium]